MNIPNNLETTVFVFKHKKTGEIQATYSAQFKDFETDPKWEHVGTLEPRLWIQAHWQKVEVHTELLVALSGAISDAEYIGADGWMTGQMHSDEYKAAVAAIAKATGAQND